jgi:hypothetical protein
MISIVSSSTTAAGRYLPIKLSCKVATCSGIAEVTGQAVVKSHKGDKTISKEEVVVLAEGSYLIHKGNSATVELKLSASGSKLLTHAKPISVKLDVSVRGGTAASAKIRIR